METYFQYCHNWCPVLGRKSVLEDSLFKDSQLLKQALALLATVLNPPLLVHPLPAIYYQQAKMLFYGDGESSPIVRIIAVMLFSWYSAGPPNMVSMDNQFWWTGVAIRQAMEIGLHREPTKDHVFKLGETVGLRRRIW